MPYTFRIDELGNFLFTCESRGDTWEVADLYFKDNIHTGGIRPVSEFPYDSITVGQMRCKCGGSIRVLPKVG